MPQAIFHKKMCAELLEQDGLLVMANGLGLLDIVYKFAKLYCRQSSSPASSQPLVFLLNSSPEEVHFLQMQLSIDQVPRGLITLTSETSIESRKVLYTRGGLIAASSTILILDLLRKNLPVHIISGFLVLRADKSVFPFPRFFPVRFVMQNADHPDLFSFLGGKGSTRRVSRLSS